MKLSPVLAYLLAGFLGKYLGFSYPTDLFDFLTLLATGLVSFEIGASLDVKNLQSIARRVTLTVIIETSIVMATVFIISRLLDISLIQTVMIGIIGIDSSTSIVYKLSEKRIDPKDRSFMLAVSSLEDVMVFVLFASLLGQSVIYTLFFSMASLLIGIGLSRYFILTRGSKGAEGSIRKEMDSPLCSYI
jgi:Kef-type K+ transport system membrane component KefB